jgi:hypothetical protein
MKKQFSILLFMLLVSVDVFADTESRINPYTLETADKKYIFVMLKGGYREGIFLGQSDKYPQSGLYLKDGSGGPLWTVDWAGFVILPPDGIHLIRKGPWPRQSDGYDVEAVSFFANGKFIKSYSVRDLVDFPWLLPQSVSHFSWQRTLPPASQADNVTFRLLNGSDAHEEKQGVVIDNNAGRLKLATLNGEEFVFDLKSGGILQATRPMRFKAAISLLVVLALYLLYLWRASAKPNKPFLQVRSKLILTPFVVFGLILLSFIVIPALAEMMPVGLARILDQYVKLGETVDTYLRTLFYFPYAAFRIESILGNPEIGVALLIWPAVFWFAVFFLSSFLNHFLVKITRRIKTHWLSEKAYKQVT